MKSRSIFRQINILKRDFAQSTTCRIQQQRRVHSSGPKNTIAARASDSAIPISTRRLSHSNKLSLALLPTSSVVRTYMITSMSSSPMLLKACFAMLRQMLKSNSIFMNPERNPLLSWVFKQTFYAQFCAGENKREVQSTVDELKHMGYSGTILEYALEVLEGEVPTPEETTREIETFRKGMLETIEMARPGDFIGLKWSGLGRQSLHLLQKNQPPTEAMKRCIYELCDAAKAKGTFFLPGAEEESTGVNSGIDSWTIDLMRKYNKDKPFMYNTYQCYLKSTPRRIAYLLETAEKEGFIPGIKLVRGAYLSHEPRSAVLQSWEETNEQYDGIVEALLKRKWNATLPPPSGSSTDLSTQYSLLLATHNAESIRKAQAIRNEQLKKGEYRVELGYAQLQGMADDISCELLDSSRNSAGEPVDKPRIFKAATWGTLTECMNFLLRRAFENQDAMGRTVETRKAMANELKRRLLHTIGLRRT
ncbi:uncharacterized protein PV09_07744 [Verruconis gallopava]|uniref:Proline dehydrogenase n=1 Tax=Verruconis gallopava TaxID=253628 RepID=A0A0D2A1X6_9PEZI|nr:uncharacterized protein PV09_07744 [Verruconis gallopava]KIW00763.1 hypothetical protein PV09_07744 [Verruconis gallopava]